MARLFVDKPFILMVDDEPEDCDLARRALKAVCPDVTFICLESAAALGAYLHRFGPYADLADTPAPGVLLLDMKMPEKDGWEVLQELKADAKFRRIPVLALTQVDDADAIARGYDLGVNAYITKPRTFERMCAIMQAIDQFWFKAASIALTDGGARVYKSSRK